MAEDGRVRVRFVPSGRGGGLRGQAEEAAAGQEHEGRVIEGLLEAVGGTPFAVPATVGRKGLARVLNHLTAHASGEGEEEGDDDDDEEEADEEEEEEDEEEAGDRRRRRRRRRAVPFDFAVAGELLRCSLRRLLEKKGWTDEEVLEVEVFLEVQEREEEAEAQEVPAWVSCLDVLSSEGVLFAGCFDGAVRALSVGPKGARSGAGSDEDEDDQGSTTAGGEREAGLTMLGTKSLCTHPIRCLQSVSLANGDALLVSGGKDHTVRVSHVSRDLVRAGGTGVAAGGDTSLPLHPVAQAEGHVNSVESVAAWVHSATATDAGMLASADFSGMLMLWSLPASTSGSAANGAGIAEGQGDSDDDDDDSGNVQRRRKGNTQGRQRKQKKRSRAEAAVDDTTGWEPTTAIKAHDGCVSGLRFIPPSEAASNVPQLLSSSWDHSIKLWDLDRQECITTLAGSRAATDMDYSGAMQSALTSHPDGRIRLWDPRESGQSVARKVFAQSKHWAASVRWADSSAQHAAHGSSSARDRPHAFATCDYDGTVRVWDARATTVSLAKWRAHQGKVFCVDWAHDDNGRGERGESAVISGGSDCAVWSHSLLNV